MTFPRTGTRMLLGLLWAALVVAVPLHAQEQWRWSGVERIVVVADVHGAHREFVEVLQATGVIGATHAWTGGAAHLVSLGDLLDRGPDSRLVMDLLMRLQTEAAAQGGAVHVLLGNHEVMNLLGDLRYVSAAEFAAFAQEEPSGARQAAFGRLAAQGGSRAEFDRRFPPGYFGHRLAFARDGRYGRWLLGLPTLIVIDGTAFVHGGLSESVRSSPAVLNERVRMGVTRYLELREELIELGALPPFGTENDLAAAQAARNALAANDRSAAVLDEFLAAGTLPELGSDGPLWYRGSASCNEVLERPVLDAALARIGAARVVVGHTVTEDRRARALHDGKLIMLDTGMLREYYRGRAAALVIERGDVAAQYLSPREARPLEVGRLAGYGLTEPQIVAALASGAVEPTGQLAADGAPLLLVRVGERVLRAAFYQSRRGNARLELAARELDRLLGFDLVPPTVPRTIDGDAGALQLQYPDAVTETDRRMRNLPFGELCAMERQLPLMHLLDALIANQSRDPDDVVFAHDVSRLKLIHHDAAFGAERQPASIPIVVPAPAEAALVRVDDASTREALAPWLSERELAALLARRAALLYRPQPR